jgi:imidazolonepropionase-like amidohydrolase
MWVLNKKEATMKGLSLLFISLLFISRAVFCAAPADGGPGQMLAIKAKKIVTVSGRTIENGVILIEGEKIREVGSGIVVPPGCRVHDYGEYAVYPGIINSMTTLGISGISSIKAWSDTAELGKFKPHISAFSAFYPWSNLIGTTREFGTLTALSAPTGGMICGKAVLFNLDGWTPGDMFIAEEAALHIQLPEPPSREGKKSSVMKEKAEKSKKELREFISHAHRYYLRSRAGAAPPDRHSFDPKFEAMKDLWKKNLPVITRARCAENIRFAIKLGKDFKLNMILLDAYDGEEVLKEIKASGYPVILGSMYSRNRKWEDGCDKVFRLPGMLARVGIPFAFSTDWAGTAFDLPIQAGRAVAYGLSREDALKGLTLNAARILGLEEYGSIEPGKIANLVVADGNILETSTRVRDVFIKGRKITGKSFFQREYERAKHKVSGEI